MSRYRIIGDQKERAVQWAMDKFPETPTAPYWGEYYSALIHELDLNIVAAVIYNSFHTGVSCDFHVATAPGARWITRPFLVEVFGYPFLELGVLRLNAKVAATNARIIRLIEHLGFVHEGTHPDAWAKGVPLLSYGMLRSTCRYLEPPYYGKAVTSAASQSDYHYRSAVGGKLGFRSATGRAQPRQSGHALRVD